MSKTNRIVESVAVESVVRVGIVSNLKNIVCLEITAGYISNEKTVKKATN